MATRFAALLVALGCGGILVVAYLLCSERVEPQMDELLSGRLNVLGIAIVTSILADVLGALTLAYATRHEPRSGWTTLLLWLAVIVPVSVALWFGLLCRLVR